MHLFLLLPSHPTKVSSFLLTCLICLDRHALFFLFSGEDIAPQRLAKVAPSGGGERRASSVSSVTPQMKAKRATVAQTMTPSKARIHE